MGSHLRPFGVGACCPPVTWLLLRRYRKSVIRHMNERSPDGSSSPDRLRRFIEMRSHSILRGSRGASDAISPRDRHRAAHRLGYATLYLEWNDMTSLHRLVFFTMMYSWVTVLGVWIVTGGRRIWVLGSAGVYFAFLVIEDLFAGAPPLNFLRIWVWYLIPTAAVILFLSRPLRGVGTLVLGAMMAAILGFQFFRLV